MKEKLLIIFLLLFIVLTLLPTQVFAECNPWMCVNNNEGQCNWETEYCVAHCCVAIPPGGGPSPTPGGGGGDGSGGCTTETVHECRKACTGGWSLSGQCGSCKKGKVCCKITTTTCVSPTPTPSCQGYNYIDAPVSGTTFVRGNSNNISGWARFCSGPAGAGVRERDDIHSVAFCRSQTQRQM